MSIELLFTLGKILINNWDAGNQNILLNVVQRVMIRLKVSL
jgi:hypothetical protein